MADDGVRVPNCKKSFTVSTRAQDEFPRFLGFYQLAQPLLLVWAYLPAGAIIIMRRVRLDVLGAIRVITALMVGIFLALNYYGSGNL